VPINIEIKPLDRQHGLRGFSCGEQRIDNYLCVNAWKEHKTYKMRVFAATLPGSLTVVGYYSLTFIVWREDDIVRDGPRGKMQRSGSAIPAIYLAKLGVDKAHARQGIGEQLVRDAFIRSIAIAENAAIATLTLDAISEDKAVWYERLGFERFADEDLKMVIALATLRKT